MSEFWIAMAGIVGIVLTKWFNLLGRKAAADERREERHAEHKVWQRDHGAAAYVDLLVVASRLSSYAWAVRWDISQGRKPGDQVKAPTIDEQATVMGLSMYTATTPSARKPENGTEF